ncbi:MAG: hypothetical protein ACR2P8_11000 [Myxococcota bacterium]
MSYVIVAYAVVLGSLLLYGLRLHAQRRALGRHERDESGSETPRR